MNVFTFLLIAATTTALRPAAVPRFQSTQLGLIKRVRPMMCASEDAMPPTTPQVVLTIYPSMDGEDKTTIDAALIARNKQRILMGQPRYDSLSDFVAAYMNFEDGKGLSVAEAEAEVLGYLQKQSILDEGGADLSDPQTAVTFGLLVALVAGIGSSFLQGGTP
jgi:hypothetical protein|mmetsp:Transcript_56507/g.126238  ORF Transcript_56507/g.126238 Transcript_56507/m.126238 type:complete len:163 (-) Transcript_56507:405-893(-)